MDSRKHRCFLSPSDGLQAVCFCNYSVNDRYLLNMAYLRLKTFTVGYSLPKVWLSKFKVQGLRVYFTGENLFTIDGVKPAIDPEIGIRTASGKSDQRNFGVAIHTRRQCRSVFSLVYNLIVIAVMKRKIYYTSFVRWQWACSAVATIF